MADKIKDSDLYNKHFAKYESDYYWNGAYSHFDGLNPQKAENMIFVDQRKSEEIQQGN